MPDVLIAHPHTSDRTITSGVMTKEGLVLDDFAGALQLCPGDVLTVEEIDGVLMATGVVSLVPTWVVELVAHVPHQTSDDYDWGSADLSGNELADAATVIPCSRRLTKHTVRIAHPDWKPIARLIDTCTHIWMYELFRTPRTQITWEDMLRDPYGMARPSFLRDGIPV